MEDLIEDLKVEIPMSNAYKLLVSLSFSGWFEEQIIFFQCDDAVGKIDKKSYEKKILTARKIKNELESSKMKFKISVCPIFD